MASAFSSSVTTPLDVIKTRLATGLLPPGSAILSSLLNIARKEGISALFVGINERILWSALYGGIGLACYEETKKLLRVKDVKQQSYSRKNTIVS